jgi:hypothetical protein
LTVCGITAQAFVDVGNAMINIIPLTGLPEVCPGDNLAVMLRGSADWQ